MRLRILQAHRSIWGEFSDPLTSRPPHVRLISIVGLRHPYASQNDRRIALESLKCVLNATSCTKSTPYARILYTLVFSLILGYYSTANATLVIWNHLLTFDKEVEFFWRRKLTGPCVLFLATRYSTLAWSIYDTPWFPVGIRVASLKRCAFTTYAVCFLEYSQYIAWAAFSTLRVYALRRRWTWATLVLLLSLAPVGARAVQLYLQEVSGAVDPHIQLVCPVTVDKLVLSLIIASRVALIVSDVVVLGVTWSVTRTYRSQGILRRFGRATTLAGVLYKNGAIYFVVLTTLNVFYLTVILLEVRVRQDTLGVGARERMGLFSDFVTITYDSFTTILVVHFMVRLQEAAHPAPGSACFASGIGTLQFARADVDCLAGAGNAAEREEGGSGEARVAGQSGGQTADAEEVELDAIPQGTRSIVQ